jgi:soluble lytic murein transglycosylase-like protein
VPADQPADRSSNQPGIEIIYPSAPMIRQTQRRVVILGVVAATAAAWAVTLGGHTVALSLPTAAASSAPNTAADVVTSAACPFPKALRGAFETASSSTSVPPALLYAVAKIESNLHTDATSSVGARGVLQLMPATAAALALDPDQPSANILGGARYLRQLLDRFGSADTALAAYNAGPTAVARAGNSAPSGDVVAYVENVDAVWHSVAGCH